MDTNAPIGNPLLEFRGLPRFDAIRPDRSRRRSTSAAGARAAVERVRNRSASRDVGHRGRDLWSSRSIGSTAHGASRAISTRS
jgi:hypothetical protein